MRELAVQIVAAAGYHPVADLSLRAMAAEQALKVGDKDLDLVSRIEEINGRQSRRGVYR